MSTIFSKIIAGDVPSHKVYEDEKTFAFLDINPVADGHLLLIPKEEHVWLQEVPDDLLCHLFITAKKLMKAMKSGLGCDYVQLSVIGKDVPHAHIHLIPRWHDDGLHGWPTYEYTDDEAEQIATKIHSKLEEVTNSA